MTARPDETRLLRQQLAAMIADRDELNEQIARLAIELELKKAEADKDETD